jgi:hypothetical protein
MNIGNRSSLNILSCQKMSCPQICGVWAYDGTLTGTWGQPIWKSSMNLASSGMTSYSGCAAESLSFEVANPDCQTHALSRLRQLLTAAEGQREKLTTLLTALKASESTGDDPL